MSFYYAVRDKSEIYVLFDTSAGTMYIPIEDFEKTMKKVDEKIQYIFLKRNTEEKTEQQG
jgi:hypothetical protein